MNNKIRTRILKYLFFIFLPLFAGINILISMDDYNRGKTKDAMVVKNGIIDFSDIEYNDIPNTRLNGEWEFYNSQLLKPEDFKNIKPSDYILVPRSWNKHIVNGSQIGSSGYATYRINIKLPTDTNTYALKIPEIYTAFKLWINDELYTEAGLVGDSKANSKAGSCPQIVHFSSVLKNAEIVVQVSNYEHKYGGIKLPIYFGTSYKIEYYINIMKYFDTIISTIMIVIGAIFMSEYLLGKRKKAIFYFSIICIMLFFRILFKGEAIMYSVLGNKYWNLAVKGEYINLTLLITYLLNFYIELYDEKTKDMLFVKKIANISALVMVLIALILPIIHMTYLVVIYISYSIFIIYIIYLVLSNKKVDKEAIPLFNILPLMSLGLILEIGGYFFDIPSVSFFSVSSLGLCGINSFLILKKSTKEFEENQLINKNLESLVLEKSNELKIANNKLIDLNKELEVEAITDPLTGIYNRRKFKAVLEKETEEFKVGRKLAATMLDIDFFKKVNDSFGHEIGDDVLQGIVEIVKNNIRATDIFARWGGEEFVILFQATDLENAVIISEKIRKAIETYNFPVVGKVTVSFGVAELDDMGAEKLISTIDTRLYKAKNSGRNKVVGYD